MTKTQLQFKKILLIFLTVLLTLSTFIGCDISSEDDLDDNEYYEDEDDDDDGGADFFPDIDGKDYNSDLNMYFAPSTNVGQFFMDEDTNDGSPMDEAVYARQEKVQRHLGIEILQVKFPDARFDDYNRYVQTAVQNMDGTIDALITHVHGGVSSLISDNLLTDLGEFDGIDLDSEYWNMSFMESLELNGNYFLGLSDYNLMLTYVVAFNKEMLDLYHSSMEKSIYDTVRDKEWTLDKMISLASLVYVDKTGDGKSADDTYGITGCCWVPFCGFLTSSNIPMVSRDQSGAYKIAINQSVHFEKADSLINTLREFSRSNSAYFDYDYSKCSVPLSSGRTLMQFVSTNSLESMLSYNVEFGVLPYPMYDIDQASVGYKSLQWGGYIGVPSYLKNPIMVGETLELLSFYSANVKITFYEKLLGKQVADMPDDAAMMDIIWDSITTDIGQTFGSAGGSSGVCYVVPELMWPSSTKNLASYIKSKENAYNEGFKKFLNGIK